MDSSSEQLCAGEEEAACTSASEGLEEGEVEGETLLIVESEDQGSVDLSHDQSGDSLTSDVGEEADGGWACEDMSFYCDRCHKWVPAGETATGIFTMGLNLASDQQVPHWIIQEKKLYLGQKHQRIIQ